MLLAATLLALGSAPDGGVPDVLVLTSAEVVTAAGVRLEVDGGYWLSDAAGEARAKQLERLAEQNRDLRRAPPPPPPPAFVVATVASFLAGVAAAVAVALAIPPPPCPR